MNSKSGREIVGYVIREGKVRGEGKYMGWNGAWSGRAFGWGGIMKYAPGESNRDAVRKGARTVGGRVVTLVRREAKPAGAQTICSWCRQVIDVTHVCRGRASAEPPKPSPGLDEAAEAARGAYLKAVGSSGDAWEWRAVAEAVRDTLTKTGYFGVSPEATLWVSKYNMAVEERDSAIAERVQLRGEVARLNSEREDNKGTFVAICRLVNGGVEPIEEHVRRVVVERDALRRHVGACWQVISENRS